jgi:hypothetical protein
MRPTLRRQDCLVGSELADYLDLEPGETIQDRSHPHASERALSGDMQQAPTSVLGSGHGAATAEEAGADEARHDAGQSLSLFEAVVTSYPTVLESLLAQTSTASLLALYHTSKHLREFLKMYPLAWKTLSFRLPQPAVAMGSPGNETPDGRDRQSKPYAFDALLKQIIGPHGSRLTSLDLCNTAVSGTALSMQVLGPRSSTLK